MRPTHPLRTSLFCFSDLEVQLFCVPRPRAADASAFVAGSGPIRVPMAANTRAGLPDPPQQARSGAIIESVLLRAS